jgi:hypothetical protein
MAWRKLLLQDDPFMLQHSLSDGQYSGITEAGTAGEALAFGDLLYLEGASGRWKLAAASAASSARGKLGICLVGASGDGEPTQVLLWGKVRADAAFPALTAGEPVFMSASAGDITQTPPAGSGNIIRVLGQANAAYELFFCPSGDWFELA